MLELDLASSWTWEKGKTQVTMVARQKLLQDRLGAICLPETCQGRRAACQLLLQQRFGLEVLLGLQPGWLEMIHL